RLRIATHTSLHTTPRSTRTTLFPYTTLFRSKEAITRLRKTEEWTKDCWLWLNRGAWHEFEIHEIEMTVPLSPAEVIRKRHAIFKHQSQKNTPVYPGDDAREFWVRAEERTAETAKIYDDLGLAEYESIEAFVRWKFDDEI